MEGYSHRLSPRSASAAEALRPICMTGQKALAGTPCLCELLREGIRFRLPEILERERIGSGY